MTVAAASSWDNPERRALYDEALRRRRSGEAHVDCEDSDSEKEFDYNNVSEEVAGEELFQHTVDLKFANVLTAKQACILSFWCAKAGAKGPVNNIGLAPSTRERWGNENTERQTGKFSRHFDQIIGNYNDENYHDVEVLGHARGRCERMVWKCRPCPLMTSLPGTFKAKVKN